MMRNDEMKYLKFNHISRGELFSVWTWIGSSEFIIGSPDRLSRTSDKILKILYRVKWEWF